MEDLERNENVSGAGCENEEEEKLLGGVAVLDFDVLCSKVALQSQGKWRLFENEVDDDEEEGVGGDYSAGVLRMWEGEILDFFDDRRVAIESLCCPCYRFGKNMGRAGLGSCFLQGTVYFLLVISAFFNCTAFIVTRRQGFLYLGVACLILLGTYLGFLRSQIRKKFNIQGSDSLVDDCIYHLICPCCIICQESRTLEMNNVQAGTWHGLGDTICVGTFVKDTNAFVNLHPPLPVSVQFHETKSTCGEEGGSSHNC